MQHAKHGFHYAASHEVPTMKTQGWAEYVKPVHECKNVASDGKTPCEDVVTEKRKPGRPPKAR